MFCVFRLSSKVCVCSVKLLTKCSCWTPAATWGTFFQLVSAPISAGYIPRTSGKRVWSDCWCHKNSQQDCGLDYNSVTEFLIEYFSKFLFKKVMFSFSIINFYCLVLASVSVEKIHSTELGYPTSSPPGAQTNLFTLVMVVAMVMMPSYVFDKTKFVNNTDRYSSSMSPNTCTIYYLRSQQRLGLLRFWFQLKHIF